MLATDHVGYTGTGFVANLISVNRQVTNSINVSTAGTYSLTMRYSAGPSGPSAAVDRTVTVTVNGASQVVTFPKTASWDVWADKTVSLVLPAGTSSIAVAYLTGNTGWINLDNLRVATP